MKPSFLFSHPAHFIAQGFGSGLAPVAPGTFGTLFAWGSFWLLAPLMSFAHLWLFIGAMFAIGLWAIDISGRALGEVDHKSIVIDEIVPFWALLALFPHSFFHQLAAFCLFRLFDITKPQPARFFDKRVKNAFGVMMDDVIAAAYSAVVLYGSLVLAGSFLEGKFL